MTTEEEVQRLSKKLKAARIQRGNLAAQTPEETTWPEEDDEGLVTKAFETLAIPLKHTMGGLESAIKGKGIHGIVEGIRRGPERDSSGADVLGAMGMEEGKLRSVLGFGLEVPLDPLNLLFLGPGMALAKALAKAGSVASKSIGLTRAMQAAGQTRLGSRLTATGTDILHKVGSKVKPTFGMTKGQLLVRKAIKGATEATQLKTKDIRQLFQAAKEHGISSGKGSFIDHLARAPGGVAAIADNLPNAENLVKVAAMHGISKDDVGKILTEVLEKTSDNLKSSQEEVEALAGVLRESFGSLVETSFKKHGTHLQDDPDFMVALQASAQGLRKMRALSLSKATKAGVPQKMWQGGEEVPGYMPHYVTDDFLKKTLSPEERKLFRKDAAFRRKVRIGDTGRRKAWRNLSIKEVNEAGAKGVLPGYEGLGPVKKVLHDDAFSLEARRQIQDANNVVFAGMLEDLAKSAIKGEKGTLAIAYDARAISHGKETITHMGKKRAVNVKNLKNLGYKGIDVLPYVDETLKKKSPLWRTYKNTLWEPETARFLEAQIKGYTQNLAGDHRWLEKFDEVQDTWKVLTLAVRPAYHTRNMVGNFFNNAYGLTGVSPDRQVALYGKAAALQIEALPNASKVKLAYRASKMPRKTMVTADDIPGLKQAIPAKKFLDEAYELGVFSGQYGADIDLGREGMGLLRGVAQGKRSPFRMGMEVGTAIEDNARLMHYLARLGMGDTPQEAALSVKKYLFDYKDITDFERKVLKRTMPFYTWSRKNIPLQAGMLLKMPYKYNRLGRAIHYIEKEAGEDLPLEDKILPEFIRDNVGVKWRRSPEGNPEYFLLGGWLPQADLAKVAKPFEESSFVDRLDPLMEQISPLLLKGPEVVLNYSVFKDRKLERFTGEQAKFLGTSLRKKVIHILKSLILLNEADRVINAINPAWSDRAPQSILSAAGQLGLGIKSYPLDWGRAMNRHFHGRRAEHRDLSKEFRYAQGRGDVKNMKIILKLIAGKERELLPPAILLGEKVPSFNINPTRTRATRKKRKQPPSQWRTLKGGISRQ